MSCSLMWKPSGKGKSVEGAGSALREALNEEYGRGRITLDHDDVDFLRGLRAAKVEGADELIELINRHDSIDVWQEC